MGMSYILRKDSLTINLKLARRIGLFSSITLRAIYEIYMFNTRIGETVVLNDIDGWVYISNTQLKTDTTINTNPQRIYLEELIALGYIEQLFIEEKRYIRLLKTDDILYNGEEI